MTKAASAGMIAHIAGETTTLATCWKVKSVDGSKLLGFTDHDTDLTVNIGDGDGSITYKAATGYTRTAIKSTASLSVDNLDVDMVLDDAEISDQDLRNGVYDDDEVKIFHVNYENLSDGIIRLRRGTLGEVKILEPGEANVELRGMSQKLSQNIVELYSPDCRADLGDSRCKVKIEFPATWSSFTNYNTIVAKDAAFGNIVRPTSSARAATPLLNHRWMFCIDPGQTGGSEPSWPTTVDATIGDSGVTWEVRQAHRVLLTVQSVTNRRLFIADNLALYASGFWNVGHLEFISGANTGAKRETRNFTQIAGSPDIEGQFETYLEFNNEILPGDQFEAVIGCLKDVPNCQVPFDNIFNYRGEPFVPGVDQIFTTPDAR